MRTTVSQPKTWTPQLAESARQGIEKLRQQCPELLHAFDRAGHLAQLESVVAVSEFALNVALRRGQRVARLAATGALKAPRAGDLSELDALSNDIATFSDRLRSVRDAELFAIAWHDLCGHSETVATLEALSRLADRLIRHACDIALANLSEELERDIEPPLILAMGKLGGGELNFSSDVDLVFLHRDAGHDATMAYAKLARRIIALLDERTAQGFVYRTDVRLRPFGSTGALSMSLGAFESYLHSKARDWERYAYLKARALTGRAQDVEALNETLRAYVYRRYLDFGVFESLRNTKGLIEIDVRRRDADNDIKRGAGGIREIEFIVQAMQLIRGGQQRELQTPSLLAALGTLERLGWLEASAAGQLRDAYLYLRHVENRLQEVRDAQTHRLPVDDHERARIAAALGESDWSTVASRLHDHRRAVQSVFESVLGSGRSETDALSVSSRLWIDCEDQEQVLAQLAAEDVGDAAALAQALSRLRRSRTVERLDRESRERLDRLVPLLLDEVLTLPAPAVAFERVARIVEGVGRRSAYFALLNENPDARKRLVGLCARSARVARDVAEKPLLLDCLIDPAIVELPSRAARSQQLRAALHGVDRDDLELVIDALSKFKSSAVFEVAVADLSARLPVMKVSDQLTWIAQSIVSEVLRTAKRDIIKRYGKPQDTSSEFCIVAYGKLGGLELAYGSDLDLVFLYDGGPTDAPTDGPRSIPQSMYYARLVQRFVHIASATTRTGSLYDIDMRLRPSGNAGPLVSRLSAYRSYQLEHAWTWEQQALLRARAVAGDPDLCAQFASLRLQLLCRERNLGELAGQVTAMRARMLKARRPQPGRFDVKHDPGGLNDVEFLVQYFLLANAHAHPDLVHHSDHMRQLDALVETGCLGPNKGEDLQSIYLEFRTRLHRDALDESDGVVETGELDAQRERVISIWQEVFGEAGRAPSP
jgi:glutamate-ammonia-ligase adenylyltransferase